MLKKTLLLCSLFFFSQNILADAYWLEIAAKDKYERTALANEGYDIVSVEDDRVIIIGNENTLQRAHATGKLLSRYKETLSPFDFPTKDQNFHNYKELTDEITTLAQNNPQIVSLSSIGTSYEGRDIWSLRLSASNIEGSLPASIFMGGHHAREHVSVEVPLRLAQYLVDEYNKKNPRIVAMLNSFEIYIIPTVNPDGKEFDVASGSYKSWRKNRSKNSTGNFGVDLNRNYGYGWGGAGASASTSDDTYRGPSAFSESETQTVKRFIETHTNITTLLSYHTFSQLVMWPWGHLDEELQNKKDLSVFKTMGAKMAKWNGYKPMKSGDLYLASGDTCDWAYGEHGIFAFTFELDPQSFFGGGFYPGQGVLDSVFQKNLEPALYLIEASDNPYKYAK
jgi:carboxypeptidase T